MSKKILLFSGDPNSINVEIIFKCWKKLNSKTKKNLYILSNYKLFKDQLNKLNYLTKIIKVTDLNDKINSDKIKIINIDLKYKNPFKVSQKDNSEFLKKSLNFSHKILSEAKIAGLINCPINKNLLGKKYQGLTEFFASKCNVKKDSEVMLIRNKKISVVPITTHIDLKKVAKKISKNLIVQKIKTLNIWFKKYEKKKPKICLLGLNPHNAEFRRNSEEKKIIIPAIKKLKKLGINIHGPLSADTIFINEYKKFDVIVGMFHDQIIAPFKSLYKFDGINITLGLDYLRVSPDHGIAKNLIGKKKANPTSLTECIKFISKFKE